MTHLYQCASGTPCDSIKILRVSLGHRANYDLVPKFHVELHASHAALPISMSENQPYSSPPPQINTKFHQCRPSEVKLRNQNSSRVLLRPCSASLLAPLQTALTSVQPTLTRRTNGNCVGAFTADILPPSSPLNVVPLTNPCSMFSSYSFIHPFFRSFVLQRVKEVSGHMSRRSEKNDVHPESK